MLAYGFSAFFAGIIGVMTMVAIPGDQIVLAGVSGFLSGTGAVALFGALILGK